MRRRKIFIIAIFAAICSIFANENLEILKAMSFLDEGQPKKAINIYERLYKNGGDKVYLKEAIRISYANSESDLERLLRMGDGKLNKDEDFWRIKVLNYISKKDVEAAIKSAYKLLDINGSSKNHLLLGLALSEANELQAAILEYQKAYELEKSDANLLALVEFIDIKLGKRSEAINYLEASRSINGCSEAVCWTLVEIYSQTRQFEKLPSVYKSLYDLTKDNSYLDKATEILVFLKRFDEIAAMFEKYKYKEEELPDIYAASGNFDIAVIKAQELYEKSLNSLFKAKVAVYKYEKSSKPIDKKNLDEVITDFEESAVKSGDPLYLNYYGYLLIDHDVDIKKGVELTLLALEKDPDSPYYLDSLAWGYYKLKECEKADEVMQKAMRDGEFAATPEAKDHEAAIKKCLLEKK